MVRCSRCGKAGIFRRIDKVTGLCDNCTSEMQNGNTKHNSRVLVNASMQSQSPVKIDEVTDSRTVRLMDSMTKGDVPKDRHGIDTLFDAFDSFVRQHDEVAQSDDDVTPNEHSRRTVIQENLLMSEERRKELQSSSIGSLSEKKHYQSIDDFTIKPENHEKTVDDEFPYGQTSLYEGKSFPRLKRVKDIPNDGSSLPYTFPPIDLLVQGDDNNSLIYAQQDMQKAKLLEDTFQSFGISAKIIGIAPGPAVTRFELQPAPGTRLSQIISLTNDIALNLAAVSIHIAPIPGKTAVGVEIPNGKVETVRLRDILESTEARKHPSRIAVGLGKDNSGRPVVADIAKMPHVLIAGRTGSGKSVCVNAIITSILFRASPKEVKLILIDPKAVELSIYNNIPHLICPVVTDPKKATSVLAWSVAEIVKRNTLFAERGVRDISSYNKSLCEDDRKMPQIVIIIDEVIDLMLSNSVEVEDSLCRIAEQGRLCGIHLVITTQNPSANVITGNIKNNIPTRIAFAVASQIDSRKIMDRAGAEVLSGNGDMLFIPNSMQPMRIQGSFVSDDEIRAVVSYIKQSGEAYYDPDMLEYIENADQPSVEMELYENEYDPKLPEAVDIAIDMGQVSISMLQRRMRIGYARAGRIIDEMSRRGIVSEADGAIPRVVMMTREQVQQMFEDQ